jgi:hypothetical protein
VPRRAATRNPLSIADLELREALCESSRVHLDVDRWALEHYIERARPGQLVVSGDQRRAEAAVLLSRVEGARSRLWLALGFPDPAKEQLTSDQKAVLAAIGRTLRLKAREMSPEERAVWIEQQRVEMRRAAGLPADEGPLFTDSDDDQGEPSR